MKNRQYESMTRAQIADSTVRVWMTEPVLTFGPSTAVLAALQHVKCEKDIVVALDALENVAAYEILDENGDGALVYPDWN